MSSNCRVITVLNFIEVTYCDLSVLELAEKYYEVANLSVLELAVEVTYCDLSVLELAEKEIRL